MDKNTIAPKRKKSKSLFDALIDGMYRDGDHVAHLSGWRFQAVEQYGGYVEVVATPPGYNLYEGAMYGVDGLPRQRVLDLLSAPVTNPPPADPVTVIVAKIGTGEYSQRYAVTRIHALIRRAVESALIETLPDLAFQSGGNGDQK